MRTFSVRARQSSIRNDLHVRQNMKIPEKVKSLLAILIIRLRVFLVAEDTYSPSLAMRPKLSSRPCWQSSFSRFFQPASSGCDIVKSIAAGEGSWLVPHTCSRLAGWFFISSTLLSLNLLAFESHRRGSYFVIAFTAGSAVKYLFI